ncbi:hypothetical protein AVEN_82299-1 [Araneus ventricosus]|uniref:Uncharacterized protein n=1 Tax=Araneus ventricosus TaxID=182803 RepID=A0A4Y2VNU2_ARAVE|nr:hypothetical protein AVEN_82299-1 [Araneus ventricosus]
MCVSARLISGSSAAYVRFGSTHLRAERRICAFQLDSSQGRAPQCAFQLDSSHGRAPHMCVSARLISRPSAASLLYGEIAAVGREPHICVCLLEQNVFYQMALLFHVSFKRLTRTLAFLSPRSDCSRPRVCESFY